MARVGIWLGFRTYSCQNVLFLCHTIRLAKHMKPTVPKVSVVTGDFLANISTCINLPPLTFLVQDVQGC